ncbi:MAG: hypothetical protein KDH96_09830 [Candidatus Riesia sp.]|nr:hypothetical protein [Candidatus Riesia sp.]
MDYMTIVAAVICVLLILIVVHVMAMRYDDDDDDNSGIPNLLHYDYSYPHYHYSGYYSPFPRYLSRRPWMRKRRY